MGILPQGSKKMTNNIERPGPLDFFQVRFTYLKQERGDPISEGKLP